MSDAVAVREGESTSAPVAGRPAGPEVRAEDRGGLEIRETALRHLVERVSLDVPGTVRHSSALLSLAGTARPRAELKVTGRRVVVRLQVAATWPCAVSRLAREVRDKVQDEVTRLSGLTIGSVDVVVQLVEAEPGRRVE